jgi:hypothetical protein
MSPSDTQLISRNDPAAVPAIIERSGGNAKFAYEEFFKATLNNEHTRRAYVRIIGRLLNWCKINQIELPKITPGLAGTYIGQLEGSAPAAIPFRATGMTDYLTNGGKLQIAQRMAGHANVKTTGL